VTGDRKVEEKKLCKKYRTNVGRLIRAWKQGLSDQEINLKTGIKMSTLYLIKQDIELTHRKERLERRKQKLLRCHSFDLDQIFFNPNI